MSDLQCPARLLLVRVRPDDGPLARRLAEERVVAEYAAPADLEDLADRHRGEAVLVIGEHDLGPGDLLLVEIDADGRRIRRWDGAGRPTDS